MTNFYKENKIAVDTRYRLFKSKVNMTYKEMVAWKKEPCSRAASIKIDQVINRVTRLLKKPKTTWTERDFNDSAKVISYISRASKIKDSNKPAAPKIGCMKGKNFYALRNWAYDRKKEKRVHRRKNPKEDSEAGPYTASPNNLRRWFLINYKNYEPLSSHRRKIFIDAAKYFNYEHLDREHQRTFEDLVYHLITMWETMRQEKNTLFFRRNYENYLRSDIFGDDFSSGTLRRNPDSPYKFFWRGAPTDKWIDYRKDTGNTGSAGPQVKDKNGAWWSVNALVSGNNIDVRDIRYELPPDYKPDQIIKREWL